MNEKDIVAMNSQDVDHQNEDSFLEEKVNDEEEVEVQSTGKLLLHQNCRRRGYIASRCPHVGKQ